MRSLFIASAFGIITLWLMTIKCVKCGSMNSGGCGLPIPEQPENGFSDRFYVQVEDPIMGSIQREYLIHVPSHYKRSNDIPVALVLDYHGWSGNAANQEFWGSLNDVADEEENETFIIVHLEGAGVDDDGDQVTGKGGLGSWNCSRTDGIYGPPCMVPRPDSFDTKCYRSCVSCDPHLSCDTTACFDDIAFTRAVINDVSEKYCIDLDSVHMSGYSNGGMLLYYAVSCENFSIHSIGTGPYFTTTTPDYYYYPGKPRVILEWVSSYGCDLEKENYPTPMDGIDAWTCSKWSGCRDDKEIVHCNGNYGHYYPFEYEIKPYIGGTRILWNFMKTHRRVSQ